MQIQPHHAPHLVDEQRSVESFHVSTRCGCRPNTRQVREIAVWDITVTAAIDQVYQ